MDERTFEIGIVLAGAVSAGAYSAGVMDFLIEALDAYETARASPDWDGPRHSVRLPVMSGASAGGMTAAISALHAFHKLEHVWPTHAVPKKQLNRLYSSWVSDISIEALLKTTDLENGRDSNGLKSALCSDVLDAILNDAFILDPQVKARQWLGRDDDHSMRVMLTLTNLRGVPYSFSLFGADSASRYGMLNHADYLDFKIGISPQAADPSLAPDGSHKLDIADVAGAGWNMFRSAALATGAFPVGLAPRVIDRTAADYLKEGKVGYEDSNGNWIDIPPDGGFPIVGNYRFVSVDGGTIDNEPLELARRYLAGAAGHNPQDGEAADKAVILIAPFPNNKQAPLPDEQTSVVHNIGELFSALIDQARFKPDELAKAQNDKIFSRFIISPVREAAGNAMAEKYPIASGALGGFSGFLHESFRRHDYLLGRRNAQAFLRWNFALPESNVLFDGFSIADHWHVRNAEDAVNSVSVQAESGLPKKRFAIRVQGEKDSFGYPIIPLTGALAQPIEIGTADAAQPQSIDLDALHAQINDRIEKVVATLINIDFKPEIDKMSFLVRGLAQVGARKIGTQILSDKAIALVDSAIAELKEAFPQSRDSTESSPRI